MRAEFYMRVECDMVPGLGRLRASDGERSDPPQGSRSGYLLGSVLAVWGVS